MLRANHSSTRSAIKLISFRDGTVDRLGSVEGLPGDDVEGNDSSAQGSALRANKDMMAILSSTQSLSTSRMLG